MYKYIIVDWQNHMIFGSNNFDLVHRINSELKHTHEVIGQSINALDEANEDDFFEPTDEDED